MKTLRALSVPFVAASLLWAVSASQASAGGMHGWRSAGCCGDNAGYGCAACDGGSVYGGFSYTSATVYGGWSYGGALGYGGCGACGGHSGFWIVGDYDAYIIGHGPMFPSGSFKPAYFYAMPSSEPVHMGPAIPAK